MSLLNFQCPSCGTEIEIDTLEPVCLCPLCYAVSGYCHCEECNVKEIEDCNRKCLRNNKKIILFNNKESGK
jgi:hypothetical protein